MKTTYWLLFAALIVQWLSVLLTEIFSQLWLSIAFAAIVLILGAIGLLQLTARDKRFWISIGCLVAATVLLAQSEYDRGEPSVPALFGIAAFFAYRITLCFFIRDNAPELSRQRAVNTAVAYGLSCVLILCGMAYHFVWYTRIGITVLAACEFLMLRLFWFCAREKGAESRRDKWYVLALVLFVLLGTGLSYFLEHHPLGSFIKETGKFPTCIVWEKRLNCGVNGWRLYVYESGDTYIPFSTEEFSDHQWSGMNGYPAHGDPNNPETENWLGLGTHMAYENGWAHHEAYLATVNDLPWPLETDYACFNVPGEPGATVEGWKLEHGWAVLLHRTNDTGPEDMNGLAEIYAYQLRHFYKQAGITPPLLFSSYTWADIFTEVNGETVFAGLPRDMTPEDMPKYYGISYKEYIEDKDAYLQAKQEGHQYYSGNLILQLDGATARCFLHFEDDVFKNMTIEISAEDNQFSDEEFKAYKEKIIGGLKSQFPTYRTGTIGNQFGDISILQSFYDGLIRIDMRYLR